MAISFVAASPVVTGSNPTVTVPAGVQGGDLLLIITCGTATASLPTGWTRVYTQGAGQFITVQYKYAASPESSVSVLIAGSSSKVVMIAYRGAGAYEIVPTATTGSGTSATTPTLTTTYANDYVLSIVSRFAGVSTLSTPAGTTNRVNSSSTSTVTGLSISDELKAATGVSTARSSTLSLSGSWSAVQIAFIESGRTLYWVGGAATWNATSTTNWSTASGGGSGAIAPTAWDNVTIDASSGTGTITCTGATCQDLTVTTANAIILGVTSSTLSVYGSLVYPSGGSFNAAASSWTTTFAATTTGKTITPNGKTLAIVNFNGLGGGWTLSGTLTCATGAVFTLTAGSFTSGGNSITANGFAISGTLTRTFDITNSTLSYAGTGTSWTATTTTNLTFVSTGSTIIGTGASASGFLGGGLTYNNLTISNLTETTNYTLSGANTFNNLTIGNATSTGCIIFNFGSNQTITGTLTTTSATSAIRRILLTSNVVGTNRIITAAAVNLSNTDFKNITGAGAASWTGTSIGDATGNSGITFTAPKTVYWNLAGAQDWYSTGWATSSGGTPAAANFPLPQDTAVFDNTGSVTGTITLSISNYSYPTIDMSARTSAMTLATSITTVYLYGSWLNGTGTTLTGTGSIIFSAQGLTKSITSNGVAFTQSITLNAPSGTVQLVDNFTSSRGFLLANGTFNATSNNVTVSSVILAAGTKSLIMGTGTWTLTGTGVVWELSTDNAGLTFSGASAPIILSSNSVASRTFEAGGSYTYNKLTIGGNTTVSTVIINNSNFNPSFTEIASTKTVAHTISFGNTGTTTIGTWSVTGTAGNVVTVNSSIGGTQRSLAITNKMFNVDYLSVQDILSVNTTPVTFWAGANSINNGRNRGIAFASGATTSAYIISTGTLFTAPANWNNTANTIHLFGAGGGGGGSGVATGNFRAGGSGGGGGAYTQLSNVTLTPLGSYNIFIGLGGTAGAAIQGANTSSTAGTGGTTTFNDGTNVYIATGGIGGNITTTGPSSTGGNGGTAQTISGLITAASAGGKGGNGGTNTSGFATSAGGGGGAGGINGTGAIGGNGISSSIGANLQAGGGGGNGGGTAGGIGVSGLSYGGGAGGNNSLGSGGGAARTTTGNGNAGTNGGGGSGGTGISNTGGAGGNGVEILGGVGSGGGAGGSTGVSNNAGLGLYGSGGPGSGSTSGAANNGRVGAQGGIVIVYTPAVTTFTGDVTENAGLTDILSALGIFVGSAIEASTLADTESVSMVASSATTENSILADSESVLQVYNPTITENSNLANSQTTQAVFASSRNEPSTLADAATTQTNFNAARLENSTLADITNAGFVYSVSITEPSILANIEYYVSVFTSAITEAITSANSQSAQTVYVVSLTEAQTLNNTQTVVAIFSAIDTEDLTVDDLNTSSLNFNSDSVENITILSDEFAQNVFDRAVIESSILADASIVFKILDSTITEISTLADSSTRTAIFESIVSENVNAADVLTAQAIFASFIGENMIMLDQLVGYGWFRVVDSQTVTWTNVNDTQSVTWTNVNDNQNPNWVQINNEQP
jgi:hypothetical protein